VAGARDVSTSVVSASAAKAASAAARSTPMFCKHHFTSLVGFCFLQFTTEDERLIVIVTVTVSVKGTVCWTT